jgi:hypothetical protein
MKTFLKLSLFVALTMVVAISCKKDRDENPTPTTPTSVVVPVVGSVMDVYGNPLSDVTVKAGTYTTTTDYSGSFYLPTASFGTTRYTISFEKQGYFKLFRSGVPQAGKPIRLSVGLISENDPTYASQKTFSALQKDSIQLPDGSEVVFPANAFISSNGNAYNGLVTVKACYLDPTWDNYGMFVFGGDLYGKDLNNSDVMLNPFSGLNVVLYDESGNTLQLDTIHNVKATVKMQIPPTLVSEAPGTIETWEYASAQGIKREKGDASKVGDKYMGQVAHFSYWSFEKPHTGKATVWGYVKRIVNNDSVGVPGIKVKVGRQILITDQDGKYEANVPDNLNGIVVAAIWGTIAINPQLISPALQNNESKRFDFVLSSSNVIMLKGVVKNANGQIIPNALVSAEWYSSSQQRVVTFTNSLGRFALPVDANASYVTLIAKTATQTATKYINYPTDTTNADITMPAIPGNNKLVVNSSTIFSITGIPQGNDVSSYFGGSFLDIYVHVPNNGLFSIYSNHATLPPVVNQQYSIPYDFTVQYGTQQLTSPDSLQSGTITFTKFPSSQGQLIEGTVTGTGWLGNQVNINFSVPFSGRKSQTIRNKKH